MSQEYYKELLSNYTRFVKRIDNHISDLQHRYPNDIACKKGCDDCCRHLSLFPVEAFCLAVWFNRLEPINKKQVLHRINTRPGDCPLLVNKTCALYAVRPIICRTHGYPITMEKNNRFEIDFCPKNFKQTTRFKKGDLLSLEHLNTTLLALNQHFLSSIETDSPMPERIKTADALFMLDTDMS